MKIMVIGPSDTRSRGGMATVIKEMRESRFLNRKYDMTIFSSYIDGNIAVRLLYSMGAYFRFLAVCRRYDLFHIHTASFGSTFRKACYLRAIRRAGKKAVVHIHGSKYLVFYEKLGEAGKRTVRNFLNSADLVLALSEGWKEKLEETMGIRNCQVLNNGIDADLLEQGMADPEKTAGSFLFLGRMGVRKGTYDLIRAVKLAADSHPDAHFYLAGDGEVEKVKEEVRENGLENQISVLGWIGWKEKLELMRQSSVIVLPSYHEGLPMALLEGMAAGKAVISTSVGAVPELVSEENGFLLEPGDVRGLAEAIEKCCEDTEMLKRMSEANRKKIRNAYSIEEIHKKLDGYYRQVMKQ